MSTDTICTKEQPCGKGGCLECDPFASEPAMEAVYGDEALRPEAIGDVIARIRSGEGAVPVTEPDSAIPSLSDCYQEMRLRYTEYEAAVSRLAVAENNVTEDRIALEQARTEVLLRYTDPKELGSNEAQRSAAIAFHTSLQTQKLQAAQRSVELLKCEAEVARIRCRMCDNTLRVVEASLGMHRAIDY